MQRDYLLTIVQLVGVVQCLFIAIALLYLPGSHRLASRWLSALFLVWMLMFAHMALRQNDLEHVVPLASFLRLPLFFLCGPLLYLYLRKITQPWEPGGWHGVAWHLAAFALVFLAYLPSITLDHNALLDTLFYRPPRQSLANTPGMTSTQEWLLIITRFVLQVFVVHLLTYAVLSLRLLVHHKRRLREHFSSLDRVSLDWMRNLLLALVLLWISAAVSQFLFVNTGVSRLINDLQMPALVLFFSALGLYGLLQKSIPLPEPVQPVSPVSADANGGKNQNSQLSDAELVEGRRKLEAVMYQAKPHLESELTLMELATRLDMPARRLSQIINAALGQNFVDFVNGYRIEEAKRLLADRSCTSAVLTIAMDVGFNSKSAFYSAFKRHTCQTPSRFREDCLLSTAPEPQR